jgi:enterochelin esterase-like enzyme
VASLRRAALSLTAGLALVAVTTGSAAPTSPPLPKPSSGPPAPAAGFIRIGTGPRGGTVWQGSIPNRFVPPARRASVVYLPPGFERDRRYPVLYLLQGFHGAPHQFSDGLRLADFADAAITSGRSRPFVAVAPPAGITSKYDGEWAGPWESYLVDDVVPWVERHLPVERTLTGRAVAGLSAGGYGAVDIGLRHPRLFGTLEAWSGYFRPFRDGPLRHADAATLAGHDPSLLVRREAPLLRRLGTRFFLSCGRTHDRVTARWTRTFARELASLHLPHHLVLLPGGHDGRFWRRQLPLALTFPYPGRTAVSPTSHA